MAKLFAPILAALGSIAVPFTIDGGPHRPAIAPVVNSPAADAAFAHDSMLMVLGVSNTHVNACCDRCHRGWLAVSPL